MDKTKSCYKYNIDNIMDAWEVTWMADHDMGEACPHTARIYVEVTTTFDSIDSTGYMLPVAVT